MRVYVFCSLMSAPLPPEDSVLEAVPFSTGRTMTPEEVQQLIQRTVQQVSLSQLPCDGGTGAMPNSLTFSSLPLSLPSGGRDSESGPGPGRAPAGPLPLERGPACAALHRRSRQPQHGRWPQVSAQPTTAKPRLLLPRVPEPLQRCC